MNSPSGGEDIAALYTAWPSRAPFRSFWMGGHEGADHVTHAGNALDMANSNGHVDRLDEDYEQGARRGLLVLRESIGWRLAEPVRGHYDFSRARRMAAAARRHGIQVLWTFMHYGTPPDVSLLDDALIDRFARFAAAAARELAPWHDDDAPPVYTPINEINFVAWAASATRLFHGYGDPDASGENSLTSGYDIKRRLVRAVLAAIEAIRAVDPRARFLHVEPAVHVVAPAGHPDLEPLAERIASYQWQAWDMLGGFADAELGGHPAALDLIGVNHYHNGQWEVETEARLAWHRRDPRRRPLSLLLQDNWKRYRRPLIISETSHVGIGRAEWFNEVAVEARRALCNGVPLGGICLYPLIDRPDWDRTDHWHHSGLWDVEPSPGAVSASAGTPGEAAFPRRLDHEFAAALTRWQDHLPKQGTTMTTLIVFSHLRWDHVYQRPQHLMSRLADHYHVVFIEEPVHDEGTARFDCLPQGPHLDVLRPHTPVVAPGFHDDQLVVLRPLLADYLRDNHIDDYLVWFYTPLPLPLLVQLHPRAVVYDCMDELSAFRNAPRQLRQRETALLKVADLVFTGGPSLYEAKRHLHPQVYCLPSAVNADHFSPARLDPDGDPAREADRLMREIGGNGQPRLGFCGVIDERFDSALLDGMARERPDWQFVMVGPVAKIDPASLPRRHNIHWLGMQSYHRLPHLIRTWDVCLMPFALNEATRFISPTKTLEYLAAEKPIVSTPIADVIGLYSDVVHIAEGIDGFIAACEEAMEEMRREGDSRIAAMQSTVSRFSWDASAAVVHEFIENRLASAMAASSVLRGLEGALPSSSPGGAAALPGARGAGAPRRLRHLVIGAGPTGLSAAYHLGRTEAASEVLLLEREERVGGWCRSVEQDGFTFDYAGHIMFSNDPYVQELYELLLGDNVHWQDREAWVYSHGVHTRYPFQGSLYAFPYTQLELHKPAL